MKNSASVAGIATATALMKKIPASRRNAPLRSGWRQLAGTRCALRRGCGAAHSRMTIAAQSSTAKVAAKTLSAAAMPYRVASALGRTLARTTPNKPAPSRQAATRVRT